MFFFSNINLIVYLLLLFVITEFTIGILNLCVPIDCNFLFRCYMQIIATEKKSPYKYGSAVFQSSITDGGWYVPKLQIFSMLGIFITSLNQFVIRNFSDTYISF